MLRFALILFFSLCVVQAHAVQSVKYIANNSGVSEDYYLDVLQTALKMTESKYGAYSLDVSFEPLSSERKHEMLIAGERVNVDRIVGFHQATGPRSALLQVNIPLLKGFMGYRIPLIRRESQAKFDKVKTLEDLRKISLGLGKGWEGYIYKTNGFNLTEPVTFDLLLKMLAGRRFDFVPLSTIEIQDSYEVDHQSLNTLVPEQHLLIYTQLPNYFYVSPQVPKLAERLRVGLTLMQSNGNLNELFDKHFSQRLKRLNLKSRRVIVIPNPQDDGSLGQFDIKNLDAH
jgi:hypothetical protein